MATIKLIHDPIGETLTIYWGDPNTAKVSEETGEGVILIKDGSGQVIGFERLYFRLPTPDLKIETQLVSATPGT